MNGPAVDRELVLGFARLLAYPYCAPLGVWLCEELARAESAEAGELVARFRAFAEESRLGELQEAYTMTFDLDTLSSTLPTCYPYVGHYLFDENHRRSAFIVGLRGRYRAHWFEECGELPDHITVLLHFLGICEDRQLVEELVDDALLPALDRMVRGDNDVGPRGRIAYRGLVRALALVLAASRPPHAEDSEAEAVRREWEREGDSLGIAREAGH